MLLVGFGIGFCHAPLTVYKTVVLYKVIVATLQVENSQWVIPTSLIICNWYNALHPMVRVQRYRLIGFVMWNLPPIRLLDLCHNHRECWKRSICGPNRNCGPCTICSKWPNTTLGTPLWRSRFDWRVHGIFVETLWEFTPNTSCAECVTNFLWSTVKLKPLWRSVLLCFAKIMLEERWFPKIFFFFLQRFCVESAFLFFSK